MLQKLMKGTVSAKQYMFRNDTVAILTLIHTEIHDDNYIFVAKSVQNVAK